MTDEKFTDVFAKLNHADVYKIIRRCVIEIVGESSHKTKSEAVQFLAKKTGVTTEALSSFINRDPPKRISRDNTTLKPLYIYCMNSRHSLTNGAKAVINDTSNWLILIGKRLEEIFADPANIAKKKRLASLSFYDWFVFESVELSRLYGKLSGDYVLCRKSISDKDTIVKSRLSINFDEDRKILKENHLHTDRQHIERQSYGFVFSVKGNIHIIMQIENVEGLEIISLRDPLQWKFKRMQGFITSLNIDRKLVNARVFIERNSEKWNKLGSRFHISDANQFESIATAIDLLLDEGAAQTPPDPIMAQVDDHD